MQQQQQQQGQSNQQNQNIQQQQRTKDEVVVIEEKVNTVNGAIHIKKYQRGKQLGKGGFAKCYEVTSLETKRIQAAKIIPKATLTKTRARSKLISEIKIHKALHNPNIVNFEHVFEDQENVYILLELCPNQTLNEIIKRRKKLHELECMCYIMQILKALQYLHKARVIHRDLKLGNIFLGPKLEVKLGDFGLATRLEFDEEKKRTICGTPNYIAPEILDDKSGHSYPVDIWSMGVIIYTLLIGKPPFETSDVKTTYNKIRKCQYAFPEHAKIEDNAKDLITSILVIDPSKRPTIDQIFASNFLNQCKIPAFLPQSSVACPLSKEFIKQYYSTSAENKIEDLQSFNNTHGSYQQKFQGNYALNSMQSEGQLNGLQHQIQSAQQQDMNNPDDKINVYVQKWVDYSNKYGLGYLLTNGGAGVYFNDSTKIILDNESNFEYYVKPEQSKQDECSYYNLNEYPSELQKKVTLLQHFRLYLREGGNQPSKNTSSIKIQRPFVYIKKWIKTRHAMMFRLQNKLVQVNFTDNTQILLSSQLKLVVYVNKQGEKSTHPLASALESDNQDMSKRLRYTKEILSTLLNSNAHSQQQQEKQKQQQQQNGEDEEIQQNNRN